MSDFPSSQGDQAQDVIIMEDHLMTVPDVNQLEALPSLSTTELDSLGGSLHDHRCDTSRGTSTSQGLARLGSARILDEDSSSPSSRPGPLQEDGLTRHEEFHEDLKAT